MRVYHSLCSAMSRWQCEDARQPRTPHQLPSVPPEPHGTARRTVTGTSSGNEEKQATAARQKVEGSSLHPPTPQESSVFLLRPRNDTNTKKLRMGLFCYEA